MQEIELKGVKVRCFSTGDADKVLLEELLKKEENAKVHTIHHRTTNWADPFYIATGMHHVNRLGFIIGDVPENLLYKQLSWRWHEDTIMAIKEALD